MMTGFLFVALFVFLILGMPIAFSLGAICFAFLWIDGGSMTSMPQRLFAAWRQRERNRSAVARIGFARDVPLLFQRRQGPRDGAARGGEIVGQRCRRARKAVGARQVAQRFPLRRIEPVLVLTRTGQTLQTVDELRRLEGFSGNRHSCYSKLFY